MNVRLAVLALSLWAVACELHVSVGEPDAGAPDAGAGTDGGRSDAGRADAGAPDASYTAQLADVSILFPLATSRAELAGGYLSALSTGPRGQLLPRAVYESIGGSDVFPTLSPPPGRRPLENLSVVAMRLDPCFGPVDPLAGGCENQLRLTFQELVWRGDEAEADDSAVHAFYSLSRKQLSDLVRALIDLRRANSRGERLGALAPHKLMVIQGLLGPMATGVRDLILANAGADRLVRVAVMDSRDLEWEFGGVELSAAADASTVLPIAALAVPDAGRQSFSRGFAGVGEQGVTTPASNLADDFSLLSNSSVAYAAGDAGREAAFDGLLRVEDPRRYTPQTADCASCHMTGPLGFVAESFYGLKRAGNPEAYVPAPTWVTPDELKATYQDFNLFGNLHAFGYRAGQIGINPRTVNESAAVVEYLNERVLFSPRP